MQEPRLPCRWPRLACISGQKPRSAGTQTCLGLRVRFLYATPSSPSLGALGPQLAFSGKQDSVVEHYGGSLGRVLQAWAVPSEC